MITKTRSVAGAGTCAWALLAAVLIANPVGVRAQSTAPPAPAEQSASPQEQQDEATVAAGFDTVSKGGITALAASLPALEQVLDRTPKGYQEVEERDGKVFFRSGEFSEYLQFTAWQQARWTAKGEAFREIVWLADPYPRASLMIGSYYNEVRQPEAALVALNRGLAFAPHSPYLVTEAAIALGQLRRMAEALDLDNRALGDDGFLTDSNRARILRSKGYMLTELGRLDEAEQAYRDSLKLDPDHKGAKEELQYIAHLKAGRAPTPSYFPTTEQARKGQGAQ